MTGTRDTISRGSTLLGTKNLTFVPAFYIRLRSAFSTKLRIGLAPSPTRYHLFWLTLLFHRQHIHLFCTIYHISHKLSMKRTVLHRYSNGFRFNQYVFWQSCYFYTSACRTVFFKIFTVNAIDDCKIIHIFDKHSSLYYVV